MICVATSVFPVPGGPMITVNPGRLPELMASTIISQEEQRFGTLGRGISHGIQSQRIRRVGSHVRKRISINLKHLLVFFIGLSFGPFTWFLSCDRFRRQNVRRWTSLNRFPYRHNFLFVRKGSATTYTFSGKLSSK